MFSIGSADNDSAARTGRLSTPHGEIRTPVFMPVGTAATVKMLTPAQLEELGVDIILGNTYHLMLRPGTDTVSKLGGLHGFSGWQGPILTDSGGFQVFSLSSLRRVTDEGVTFRSHVDGAELFLGPVEALEAQKALAADIAMVLDECPPAEAERAEVKQAVARTIAWARTTRALDAAPGQAVFAIVQGGRFRDLRETCARELVDMDFPGYAIGGLSVGESRELRREALAASAPLLPKNRPRYVMGIGEPIDILDAVEQGCDMFDCVLPTRNGRNGSAFTFAGPVQVRNARFRDSEIPVEDGCTCYCCSRFSSGYIRHLFNTNEALGPILVSMHNIHFYMEFMRRMRAHIEKNEFARFKIEFCTNFYSDLEGILE